jgi:hypothetical protein
MIISKKLETAASAIGKIVKQGAAANGAVACGKNEQPLGPVVGSADNETFAVGDHIDIACVGEVSKVLLESAVSAGDNLMITAGGICCKFDNGTVGAITIGGASNTYTNALFINRPRLGIAKTNGVAGDLIEAVVTNDYVLQISNL